ncbi:MAG: phosphodiester glycosidase family protein [Solirubrobacterales bacterium]
MSILVVLLSPLIYSYATWMLRPSSMAFFPRSVEWVRADVPLGNQLVDQIEHAYYSWNAPSKGGPQLTSLPATGVAAKAPSERAATPPRIKPVFPHRLPGEGVWKPTGPPVRGGAPVLVTTFRPETDYPRNLAYLAWFDHTRTALAFYPGRYEPPSAAVRGPAMVPESQRRRLLATFNAGFIYRDVNNGSTDNGRINEPLAKGNATLLGYRDGRVAIKIWNGGPNAGPNVAWSRQSLPPIIWHGRLNPNLNDSTQWGFTVGNAVRVWRTGVGIDRRGNLIFAAANDMTVTTLARVLQRAGAVRAMQFDINADWHTLITYTHHHGLRPTQVGPSNQPDGRYLTPDDRDFFAVYRRQPGPVTVPFK